MKQIFLGIAIFMIPATASLAQPELPDWALQILKPVERAVHVLDYGKQGFNDGNPAFIVAASAVGDSLGGRLITAWLYGLTVQQSASGAWVDSEFSGPHDYVRVFDSIPLAEARAAIEAASGLLRLDEYIWAVHLQEVVRIHEGLIAGTFKTGAVGVCAATEQWPSCGREFEVRQVSGALVATYGERSWQQGR